MRVKDLIEELQKYDPDMDVTLEYYQPGLKVPYLMDINEVHITEKHNHGESFYRTIEHFKNPNLDNFTEVVVIQ
ncbi:MAG: hypothetical protein R3321_05985 [Nitrososphaeraceae archaeon]|nr:hypothetical protein [Nitrososphaeraceae archaeon]